MKPKIKEREFTIQFTVTERKLGTVLADLNNAPGLKVSLIEERDPVKNMPRGSMLDAAYKMLREAPAGLMNAGAMRRALVEAGFTQASVATQVRKYGLTKRLIIKGKNGAAVVSLPRGV